MSDEHPFIYLNNAATSWPKPPEVIEAVNDSLAQPISGGSRSAGSRGTDYVSLARERVSSFLGAEAPENIIFTQNATDSLNILIAGFLAGKKDCHALAAKLDHNSVLRPLTEHQVRFDCVNFTDGMVNPEDVEAAIRADTRLMVMTHASNVLGSVQKIQEIGTILHEHDIFFIVDGAQTAGHIPVSLKDMPADAYVFTGHKGLFGIAGTGGFYLRDAEAIAPTRFGGTGTDSRSLLQPREMPERFECGTHNYPGLAALAAGVSFLEKTGIENITAKAERQTEAVIRELNEEENISVYCRHPKVPIVSFNIDGLENDDVGFLLARKYHITTRSGLHCAPLVHETIDGGRGCVRMSMSYFTTDEECTAAAEAVREIARNAARKFHSA